MTNKNIKIVDILNKFYSNHKYTSKGKERVYCCFFHNDTTPSLNINIDKDTYHCFGCNAKGNANTLLKHYYNNDDSKAVYIQYLKDTNQYKENYTSNHASNHDIAIEQCNTIEHILKHCTPLQAPTEYMLSRGINNISSNDVYILNKTIKYTIEDKQYSASKGVVIIPIYKNETIISLQFLIQDNSKENNKFFLPKHSTKHGYASFIINDNPKFFIVEGVYDALCINMAGYNAVACLNAYGVLDCSLYYIQSWYSKGIIYCDSDDRGKENGRQASKYLNTTMIFATLKDCKDVNDVVNHENGLETLARQLKNVELDINEVVENYCKQKRLKSFQYGIKYAVSFDDDCIFDLNRKQVGEWVATVLGRVGFTQKIKIDELSQYVLSHSIPIKGLNYNPKYNYFEVYSFKGNTYLNTYTKQGLHAKTYPKCQLTYNSFPTIYNHLVHICGNVQYAEWFIEFLAHKWQQPHVRNAYIPIFQGIQGSGKGLLNSLLFSLFGNNVNKNLQNKHFKSDFNRAFKNILFGVLDDTDKDASIFVRLKQLTGSDSFNLNDKHEKEVQNYGFFGNIIMMSNNDDVYNALSDDRRAVFFKQSSKIEILGEQHKVTMIDIVSNDENNELIAFSTYLANLPLSQLIHLITESRGEALCINKSIEQEFIEELSNDFKNVIQDINNMNNVSFPNLVNDIAYSDDSGYFIAIENKENEQILLMSSSMFINMFNLRYKVNNANNRKTYRKARELKIFSYDEKMRYKGGRFVAISLAR